MTQNTNTYDHWKQTYSQPSWNILTKMILYSISGIIFLNILSPILKPLGIIAIIAAIIVCFAPSTYFLAKFIQLMVKETKYILFEDKKKTN